MLDDIMIKEAENNVRKYLEDNLMNQSYSEEIIIKTYHKNARESLHVAILISDNQASSLWIIVASYYAMFYMANAVLHKLGYRIGEKISHKITSDALIVFVRNKLRKSLLESYEEIKEEALGLVQNKADEIIQNFEYEREKRGKFQYNMDEELKTSKATTSLQRAKEFLDEMENLLGK